MKYVHTNIVSNDWKRLVDFYVKVFRCMVVPPVRSFSGDWLSKGTGVNNAKLEGAHLRLPGCGPDGPTLEIYQYGDVEQQNAINPNTRGIGHLAFEVDDVQEVLKEMENSGGNRFGEVTTREVSGVGTITFVYARDPEGNLIELQSWNQM